MRRADGGGLREALQQPLAFGAVRIERSAQQRDSTLLRDQRVGGGLPIVEGTAQVGGG